MQNQQTALIEKERRKQWLTFGNKHKYIDPEVCLKLNHDMEPIPYRFTIHLIDKINIPFKQAKSGRPQYFINFNATFFSTTSDQYFGRTYKSKPIELAKINPNDNFYRTMHPHTFFYHSTAQSDADIYNKQKVMTGNTEVVHKSESDVIMIFDAEIKEITEENHIVLQQELVGFSIIDKPISESKQKSQTFYQGTAWTMWSKHDKTGWKSIPTN